MMLLLLFDVLAYDRVAARTIIHINFCRQEGRGSYRLTNAMQAR